MNESHGACWMCGGLQPWTRGVGLCGTCWERWADQAHDRFAVAVPDDRGPADDDPPGYRPPPEWGDPVG